jgi:hypothetical protein
MAISNAQRDKINKMNRAAQDASLGTVVQDLQGLSVKSGTYTMVAADQTAGSKAIATGLGKNITGFMVQIYRANVLVSGATITKSSANLTIATNGSTYVVTTGDVVNYIVW